MSIWPLLPITADVEAPAAPNRRLIWIVRLVFYPLAIGLIALAWHQRRADADDSGVVARPPVVNFLSSFVVVSKTVGPQDAIVRLEDLRPVALTIPVRFTCVPDLGDVHATYSRLALTALPDGRARARLRRIDTTWDNGWYGLTDVTFDGRLAGGRLRADVSARMALDANGVRADCRSGPIALTFHGSGDGDHPPPGF